MKSLTVPLKGREYDILIENGLLRSVGDKARQVLKKSERCLIVTDENVAPLYLEKVENSMRAAGFMTASCVLPAGEETKCLNMLGKLYDELTALGVTRTDCILALGGGVIGDLAGFAAATILRGIAFIQVPTTLLAQVDSSVGGKVAIDLPAGKNLAGAFWQPSLVVIDPDCLDTLPDREFSAGMAEVIKYGCIKDKSLFELIAANAGRDKITPIIGDIIYTCCSIKADVVLKDEHDTSERRLLNYGHTIGHAAELHCKYRTYNHGEAVAAGMLMANEIGESLGFTPKGLSGKISAVLKSFSLPTEIIISRQSLISAVSLDKKSEGGDITLILLSEIGTAHTVTVKRDELFNIPLSYVKG